MIYLLVFVFGALVGSFLNVCIGRIPNGESIITPPSHCLKCQTPIAFYDNVPILSWLVLRGRCRFCHAAISPRYLAVELLMGLFSSVIYYRFGLSFSFAISFVFVAALIVISFIDLDVRIVPDVISLPGIILGLAFSVIGYFFYYVQLDVIPTRITLFIGIVAGGGFLLATAWAYEKFTGVEGIGGGDIKLLAMIGAFLGWPSIPITLFIASLLGSILGIGGMLLTGAGRRMALPFAPFLCSGALIYLFYGNEIIQFYLPSP